MLAAAAVLCLYVLGVFLVRGNRPFERHQTSLGEMLLAYMGWALLSGGVIGILWPIGRSKWGKALVGTAVSILFYGASWMAVSGFRISAVELVLLLVVSTVLGTALGHTAHRTFGSDE